MVKRLFILSLILTGCVSIETKKMPEPEYTKFMLKCITSGFPTYMVYASVCDCLSDVLQKKGTLTEEDATSCSGKVNEKKEDRTSLPKPQRREIEI